jgi:hypothetical protein
MTEGQIKQVAYEEARLRHRLLHPIIENQGEFVITPELEAERARRINKHEWRDPQPALSAADIEILQLKGVI